MTIDHFISGMMGVEIGAYNFRDCAKEKRSARQGTDAKEMTTEDIASIRDGGLSPRRGHSVESIVIPGRALIAINRCFEK
jgi:hypothetical protein